MDSNFQKYSLNLKDLKTHPFRKGKKLNVDLMIILNTNSRPTLVFSIMPLQPSMSSQIQHIT